MTTHQFTLDFYETKICTKCKVDKPLLSFYSTGKKKTKDGKKPCCKQCHKLHYELKSRLKKRNEYREHRGPLLNRIKLFCPLIQHCSRCKIEKSYLDFKLDKKRENVDTICKKCVSARKSENYQKNEEAKQRNRERQKLKRLSSNLTAEDRERRIKARRKYRQKLVDSGLTTNGTPRIIFSKPTPEQVAVRTVGTLYRKWHRNWLKTLAPYPCVAAIYAATGKPWNNPRLNEGQKFTMRYELDTEFRAGQILKTQGRKAKRAALIAAQSDGTVNYKTLGALFAGSKDCCYCGAPLTARQKTADHIVPLTQGGLHSMTNLAICCISCNSSKRDRTPEQWLTSGLQKSRWTALISSKQPTFSA
jgi:5-methylcytosine-specific restriction endonuclease McrA